MRGWGGGGLNRPRTCVVGGYLVQGCHQQLLGVFLLSKHVVLLHRLLPKRCSWWFGTVWGWARVNWRL